MLPLDLLPQNKVGGTSRSRDSGNTGLTQGERGAYYIAKKAMEHKGWERATVGPSSDDIYFGIVKNVPVVYLSGSNSVKEWGNNIKGVFRGEAALAEGVVSIEKACKSRGYTGKDVCIVGFSRGATQAILLSARLGMRAGGLITLGCPGGLGKDVRRQVRHIDISGRLDPIDFTNALGPGEKPHKNAWYWIGHLGYDDDGGPLDKYGSSGGTLAFSKGFL